MEYGCSHEMWGVCCCETLVKPDLAEEWEVPIRVPGLIQELLPDVPIWVCTVSNDNKAQKKCSGFKQDQEM